MVKLENIKTQNLDSEPSSPGVSFHSKSHRKIKWSYAEDRMLLKLIEKYGAAHWSKIAKHMPTRRGKQCRQRWHNHLNPRINKNKWSSHQEWILFLSFLAFETKWALMSLLLRGRTDNNIKNHWNSIMKKKVLTFNDSLKNMIQNKKESYLQNIVNSPYYLNVERKLLKFIFQNNTAESGIEPSFERINEFASEFKNLQSFEEQLNETVSVKDEYHYVKQQYDENIHCNMQVESQTEKETFKMNSEEARYYQFRQLLLEEFRLFFMTFLFPVKIKTQY